MKNKSIGTGVAFIAIAVLFGLNALHYTLGTIDQPGPGFFPLTVSIFLLLLGIGTSITGLTQNQLPIDYRLKNISIISVALLGFAAATDYINMIVGIVVLVVISSFCATSYSVTRVVKIIIGLVAVAFAFKYLLGLNLPL